jgi:ketosteroid isomerase-like protein
MNTMTQVATQLMADERALNELLTRYARGVDRCDEDLVRSCYHEDATDERGWFKGRGHDFAREIVALRKGGPLMQHAISNVRVDVRGDVAFGESYVMVRTTTADEKVVFGFGRYIDRFERRDGEWRIASRRVTLESPLLDRDPSQYPPATQDRDDPSYER